MQVENGRQERAETRIYEHMEIPMNQITRGRRIRSLEVLETEQLAGLVDSIRTRGVMQPILVRIMEDGHYELLCGERRLNACEILQKDTVPAQIVTQPITDVEAVAIELEENLQRTDLTPIEEAIGYQLFFWKSLRKSRSAAIEDLRKYEMDEDELDDETTATISALTRISGKSPKTLQNYMRLLRLPKDVQVAVSNGRVCVTAAYELEKHIHDIGDIQVENIFRECLERGLSAKQVKEKFARLAKPAKQDKKTLKSVLRDLTRFEDIFEEILDEQRMRITEQQADKLLLKLQELLILMTQIKGKVEKKALPTKENINVCQ